MSASREKRDVYYRLAKTIGVRARSAFKLAQLQKTCGILDGVDTILDLCAAPGGWSALCQELTSYRCSSSSPITNDESSVDEQNESVLTAGDLQSEVSPSMTKTIIAVDCVSIAPIPGVTIIKGDITRPSTANDILDAARGRKVDIVLFDGAPDVTGQLDFDETAQHALILAGATLCLSVLREDGVFVAKMFRGAQTAKTCSILANLFTEVVMTKPQASRNSSLEGFVLCSGFRPSPQLCSIPLHLILSLGLDYAIRLSATATPSSAPVETKYGPGLGRRAGPEFVCCPDKYDSDKSYPLQQELSYSII